MENLLTAVIAVLRSTPSRWQTFAESYPPDLLNHSPAAGEWSAVAVLSHLLDTERYVFPVRVRSFLAGQDFQAFDPDREGTPPKAAMLEMVSTFAALRAESLTLLETLTTADLDRRARHAELGVVSLAEMLHEWAGHDLMHTVQAEQAMMQPFIAGCGAWQIYFTKHRAEQT